MEKKQTILAKTFTLIFNFSPPSKQNEFSRWLENKFYNLSNYELHYVILKSVN